MFLGTYQLMMKRFFPDHPSSIKVRDLIGARKERSTTPPNEQTTFDATSPAADKTAQSNEKRQNDSEPA